MLTYRSIISRILFVSLVITACASWLYAGIDENKRRIQAFIDSPELPAGQKLSPAEIERTVSTFVDELVNFRKSQKIFKDNFDFTDLFSNYKKLPRTQSAADIFLVVAARDGGFGHYVNRTCEIIKRLLVHEAKLLQQNQTPFIHGLYESIFFMMDMYTQAWSVAHNKSVNNFTFVRFNDLQQTLEEQLKVHREKEVMRKKIMQKKGLVDFSDRPNLLFMNSSIVGNYNRHGAFTLEYFVDNWSINNPHMTGEHVAGLIGMQGAFAKYKREIKALQDEHKRLCNGKGVILQLAFTDKAMQDRVYVAAGGGYANQALTEQGISTDDISLVTQLIRANPTLIDVERNPLEFCMVIDNLEPGRGVEMYPFYNASAADVRAYQQKRDRLFATIKKELSRNYLLAMKANYAKLQSLLKKEGQGK